MFPRKLIFTLCWRKCPFFTTLLQKNYFSADSVEHTGKLSKVFESQYLSILMNFTLLLIRLHSLIFSFWTANGLYRRYKGTLTELPQKRKLWLGVCADYSKTVVIPVVSIRFYSALHTSWTWAVFLFWLLFNYSKQSASATLAAKTRFANY